jgi:hypothetical protein
MTTSIHWPEASTKSKNEEQFFVDSEVSKIHEKPQNLSKNHVFYMADSK